MTRTDDSIKFFTDSTERRIQDLYHQNREDFADLRGLMKDTNARIMDTQLEVAAINVRVDSLATKTQLVETIGQVHDWCLAQMDDHLLRKHKSKPPPRDSLLPRDSNGKLYKLLGKVAAGLAALTMAVWGLVSLLQ